MKNVELEKVSLYYIKDSLGLLVPIIVQFPNWSLNADEENILTILRAKGKVGKVKATICVTLTDWKKCHAKGKKWSKPINKLKAL